MIRWAFADLCDIAVLPLAKKIILISFMDGLPHELLISNSEKTKFYLKGLIHLKLQTHALRYNQRSIYLTKILHR